MNLQIELLESTQLKRSSSLTDKARAQNALSYAIALHRYPLTQVRFIYGNLYVIVDKIKYKIERVKNDPKLTYVLGKLHERA